MKEIRCHLGKRSYSIYVGTNALFKCATYLQKAHIQGKVLVVTNRKVFRLFFSQVKKHIRKAQVEVHHHLLPDSEEAKSQKELFRLYNKLLKIKCDRYSTIIALGGGVIGDVCGFCASTYMRGINFINIPTTLLAQVDSAIGGKTAINLEKGKNLVGTFYQPRFVVSDSSFLSSLSRRQRAISLSEVVKYGVIWDKNFFSFLERNIEKALAGNLPVLEHIVCTSSKIKVRVVEQDEMERTGLRAILNFGHTFGHAFEAAGQYTTLAHGEAVALGMIAAARLAQTLGIFTKYGCVRIEDLVKRIGLLRSLKSVDITTRQILYFMQFDKKSRNRKISLVLPTRIGHVKVLSTISRPLIEQTVNNLFF